MSGPRRRKGIVAVIVTLIALAITISLWVSLLKVPAFSELSFSVIVATDGRRFAIASPEEMGSPPGERIRNVFAGAQSIQYTDMAHVAPGTTATVSTLPGLTGRPLWSRRAIDLDASIRVGDRLIMYYSHPGMAAGFIQRAPTPEERSLLIAAFADYLETNKPALGVHEIVRNGSFTRLTIHGLGYVTIGVLGLLWVLVFATAASFLRHRDHASY